MISSITAVLKRSHRPGLVIPLLRMVSRGVLAAGLIALSGCMSMVSSFTSGFAEDLGNAILDNPDVEMVQEGAPAYLLLMDALVAQSPDNPNLLLQSSRLTSAYAAAFVSDPERAKLMADKSFADMQRSICLSIRDGCELRTRPYDEFEAWVNARTVAEV
ncbi:MAG: hypothetical protein EP301_06190, partial [Gammaproteobacteria bacterium]